MKLRLNDRVKLVMFLITLGGSTVFSDRYFWASQVIKSENEIGSSATTASQQRTAAAQCEEVCEGRFLVKMSNPIDASLIREIQTFAKGKIGFGVTVRQVGGLNVLLIEAPGINMKNFRDDPRLTDFQKSFRVDYMEPDMKLRLHTWPGDKFFPNQWGLVNTGQRLSNCSTMGNVTASSPPGIKGTDINVGPAWAKQSKPGKITVAVLDTGLTSSHPDLTRNLWRSPKAFNLVVGGPLGKRVRCKAGSNGFNSITNKCDPTDKHRHGTSVAGIIGAVRDDTVGTVGVDPDTSIMALKAFEYGTACVSQVVNAIDFLIQVKNRPELKADIRVVNNSYGLKAQTISPCKVHEDCESKVLKEGVKRTLENGILFVAAAGNGRRDIDCIPEFPAGYDFANIISVAALTNLGDLATFSNFGVNSVDLVAPGVDICAPGITDYYYANGTSMAAPFVSGSASLLLSRCGLSLSYKEIKELLMNNANWVDLNFDGNAVRGRRLDVGKAVSACAP